MHVLRRTLIVALLLVGCTGARAAHAEVIHDFDVTLSAASSGTLTVTERIAYDFEDSYHHGIYRIIPTAYTRSGLHYNVRLTVESVTDEQGSELPYTVSHGGGATTLKIGDPNVTITGAHTYVLTYAVDRAINWFAGEPEVYWNATGTEWPVDIERSTLTLTGMEGFSVDRTVCYTGALGATESNCTVTSSAQGVQVDAAGLLAAYEGLTVAARLPAGSIPEPTALQRAWQTFQDNWGFGLPLVALVVLIALYRKHGRDPRGRGTIVAEYEAPAGMHPAMLGYLVDEQINPRDITAAIIGLAAKGCLKIVYEEGEILKRWGHSYRLQKRQESSSGLSAFERQLLKALFAAGDDVQLKDLKTSFPKELTKLKRTLSDEAQTASYFVAAPSTVRATYLGVGIAVAAAGFFLLTSSTVAIGVGLLLSGILILGFSRAMPRRTEQGVLARDHILGLKEYLTVAEKDRLQFHNAPAKKPEQFFALLPYAIALAVEKEWAQQFKDLTLEQPDWYAGQQWSTFNAYLFASAMGDFSHAARSQAFVAPAPSAGAGGSGFGGGGFSGGGFGGGGGGSW